MRDTLSRLWQHRFSHGLSLSIGSVAVNRYDGGEWVLTIQGPALFSAGTGHWPWYMFEASMLTGAKASWHIGLLGFTVGKWIIHDLNEEGELVGPDKSQHYFFFKGLNHHQQSFEEIINNAR